MNGTGSRYETRSKSPPSLFDIANSSPSFDFQNAGLRRAARLSQQQLQAASSRSPTASARSSIARASSGSSPSADDVAYNMRHARLQVVASLGWLMRTHLLQVRYARPKAPPPRSLATTTQ
jgi:hypothetical protein